MHFWFLNCLKNVFHRVWYSSAFKPKLSKNMIYLDWNPLLIRFVKRICIPHPLIIFLDRNKGWYQMERNQKNQIYVFPQLINVISLQKIGKKTTNIKFNDFLYLCPPPNNPCISGSAIGASIIAATGQKPPFCFLLFLKILFVTYAFPICIVLLQTFLPYISFNPTSYLSHTLWVIPCPRINSFIYWDP